MKASSNYMEKLVKADLSEFYIFLVILFLSAVYIWTALPDISILLRTLITVIALVLALILAYNTHEESNQKSETQLPSSDVRAHVRTK